jgi:succinate dehydrogenase / fumarate reductase flavoprotein subunit
MITGEIRAHTADVVVLATGGYSNVFYLSTNAKGCNTTAIWRAHKRGAYFANPCFTQIHPTCIPPAGEHQSKLTLMSESLRNDGRIWVPRKPADDRPASQIPESERYYFLEEKYPSFGNLVPRDVASRNAKTVVDAGQGVGPMHNGVFLDFADSIKRLGESKIRERYGNLFDIYLQITGEDAYKLPMRIYPAPHYTMGGLWVDYNLESTVPGLFVIGEANFSDHGANRLGASALMQGLADGYFVLPYTLPNYLATTKLDKVTADSDVVKATVAEVKGRINHFMQNKGGQTTEHYHRELGKIMWGKCGMGRNAEGLAEALVEIPKLREEFYANVRIPGDAADLNSELEKVMRVADYFELGELMCYDALQRNESCGGHFREEYQTEEGEALRDDENFTYVAAWQYAGEGNRQILNKEPLGFEYVKLSQRSYK